MLPCTSILEEEQFGKDTSYHISLRFLYSLEAIVTIDQQGKILNFNKDVSHVFGYGAWELKNQNVKVFMPPDSAEKHDSYLSRYLSYKVSIGFYTYCLLISLTRMYFRYVFIKAKYVIDSRRLVTAMHRDKSTFETFIEVVETYDATLGATVYVGRMLPLTKFSGTNLANYTNNTNTSGATSNLSVDCQEQVNSVSNFEEEDVHVTNEEEEVFVPSPRYSPRGKAGTPRGRAGSARFKKLDLDGKEDAEEGEGDDASSNGVDTHRSNSSAQEKDEAADEELNLIGTEDGGAGSPIEGDVRPRSLSKRNVLPPLQHQPSKAVLKEVKGNKEGDIEDEGQADTNTREENEGDVLDKVKEIGSEEPQDAQLNTEGEGVTGEPSISALVPVETSALKTKEVIHTFVYVCYIYLTDLYYK
jgi:hypothetical protein